MNRTGPARRVRPLASLEPTPSPGRPRQTRCSRLRRARRAVRPTPHDLVSALGFRPSVLLLEGGGIRTTADAPKLRSPRAAESELLRLTILIAPLASVDALPVCVHETEVRHFPVWDRV